MLLRPSGEPFYIGMGSGHRIDQHEKRAGKGRSRKASIIRSILAAGDCVGKIVVDRFATAHEAKALEIALISEVGRMDLGTGPLANHTAGGDGVTGWSPEMRTAQSTATANGMSDPAVRDNCRQHANRLHAIPEWSAARAAELREYWQNPKNRAMQAERVRNHFADKSVRQRHAEVVRSALRSPEAREKMRSAKLGRKQDPELVAKRAAALRKPRRPGTGARISAGKRAAAERRLQQS